MGEADKYAVRVDHADEPVVFRAYVQNELTLDELAELEQRLNSRLENWSTGAEMKALLWHSARRAGRLAELLPPDERPDRDSIPGLLEGLSWDAVGRLTALQVEVLRPESPAAELEDDTDPPAGARE
jgi:hypothetical protein